METLITKTEIVNESEEVQISLAPDDAEEKSETETDDEATDPKKKKDKEVIKPGGL
ncbi:MAG: hypothetical protein AAF611_01900 [Bacteroidota bacterium]